MGKHFKKYQNSGNFKNQNGRPPHSEPTPIFQGDFKSPYNFVPFYDDHSIFRPKWSNLTFQDIPFENGESGEIHLTIHAEGDIFIRNGHAENDRLNADEYCKKMLYKPNLGKNNDAAIENQSLESLKTHANLENEDSIRRYLQFSNHDGNYFIPATSLKGAIRNTFEIITASKIKVDEKIRESNFGLRDMANGNNYRKIVSKSTPGWLYQKDGKWFISKAAHFGKIKSEEICDKFNLSNEFYLDNKLPLIEKLRSVGDNVIKKFTFSTDNINKITYYSFSEFENLEGYLVVYGNIGKKRHEYIFGLPDHKKYNVPDFLIENHIDINNTIDSKTWEVISNHYSSFGKIPVFFTYENQIVTSFGITKLYRLNNTQKIKEYCPCYLSGSDLTETLFGTTKNKGRVLFSHLWGDKIEIKSLEDMKVEKRVLSSPKPSYYPTYLSQDSSEINNRSYFTYCSDPLKTNTRIRGFKKYPIHQAIKPEINYDVKNESENDKIFTFFSPISNKTFTGKIRFHNLRPEEIGALIAALTHHGNDHLFHNLGSGKPYGYGKIKIQIKEKEKWMKYLNDFNMCLHDYKVNTSEQIKELFSMAELPSKSTNNLLRYPELELPGKADEDKNEFNNYKKKFQFLRPYSEYFQSKKDE